MKTAVVLALFVLFVAQVASRAVTAADCTAFCAAANSTCGVANLGMLNPSGCLAFCQILVGAGLGGDTTATTGNSIGCRWNWVNQTNSTNMNTQCKYASLTGGSQCGNTNTDRCTTYCALNFGPCNATWSIGGAGANISICALTCAGSNGAGGYNQSGIEYPFATTGDSVQCRTYHSLAANLLDYTHCAHSSPLGGLQCGTASDAVKNFCNGAYLSCNVFAQLSGKPNLFPYSSIAQCISDASQYSTTNLGVQFGPVNATTGDDLGCRAYHAGLPSLADPTTHCPHAGWSSAPCGNRPTTQAPTTMAPTTMAGTTMAPTTETGAASTISAVLAVVIAIVALLF